MKALKLLTLPLAFIAVLAPLLGSLPMGQQLGAGRASASASFSAGHIIDDNIFTNSNTLSVAQIQKFLDDMINGMGGCYAPGTKSTNPPNGACINQYVENTSTLQNNFSNPGASIPGGISAAQIIYNAAHSYSINPEVLLVTLQKEQGLITDNWPWYSEYKYAMGYSCPDTSAGCSSNYADFYKQVDGSAWQYRYYLNNPGAFNYWLGVNNIAYAPSPCSSSSAVSIVNAATAALYIYTPYQPDSNVLSHTNPIGSNYGPGPIVSGDSCATYGNRNFWWYFNTWFGPSIDTDVSLAEESGTTTVYVLYDGQKQGVPTPDVLSAWGLNGLPITPMDSSVFNSIPTTSTILSRYAVNASNNQSYFADNGNVFYVSANDAATWGFQSASQAKISTTLINFAIYQGEIKPFVYVNGSPTIYAVDNGALHGINSGTNYELWAGANYSAMRLSSTYQATMPTDTVIQTPLFSYGGQTYVLSDARAYSLTNTTRSLLPSAWGTTTIQQGLFNTFSSSGSLQYMVQGSSPTVYLLDNGLKRGIINGEVYGAFQTSSNNLNTSFVSDALLSSISDGAVVSSNLILNSGSYYTVYHGLHLLSSNLVSAFNAASNALTIQSDYTTLLPGSSAATRFINEPGSPAIFFVDNGKKLPFNNPTVYGLTGGGSLTSLTSVTIQGIPTGDIMSDFVTDGTTNYLLDKTSAFTLPDNNVAQAWGLSEPITLTAQAIADYVSAGQLSQRIQIPDGHFCLVDSAKYYCANDSPTLATWQLNVGAVKPSQLLLGYHLSKDQPLGSFVMGKAGQPYANTAFVAAKGSLFGIRTLNNALNIGFTSTSLRLDQTTLASWVAPQPWQGYLANDDSGNTWVLDGGVKRSIPSSYLTAWTTGQTPTTLGTDFLNTLTTSSPIGNAIKYNGDPTIYGIKNGMRYGMPSPDVYAASGLGPASSVSSSLLNSIPDGGVWQN